MKNILHEQEEKHVPDYVSNLKHLKMDNCDILMMFALGWPRDIEMEIISEVHKKIQLLIWCYLYCFCFGNNFFNYFPKRCREF